MAAAAPNAQPVNRSPVDPAGHGRRQLLAHDRAELEHLPGAAGGVGQPAVAQGAGHESLVRAEAVHADAVVDHPVAVEIAHIGPQAGEQPLGLVLAQNARRVRVFGIAGRAVAELERHAVQRRDEIEVAGTREVEEAGRLRPACARGRRAAPGRRRWRASATRLLRELRQHLAGPAACGDDHGVRLQPLAVRERHGPACGVDLHDLAVGPQADAAPLQKCCEVVDDAVGVERAAARGEQAPVAVARVRGRGSVARARSRSQTS